MSRRGLDPGGATGRPRWRSSLLSDPRRSFHAARASDSGSEVKAAAPRLVYDSSTNCPGNRVRYTGPREGPRMAKHPDRTRRPKELVGVPWLTAQGTLDLTKFPIEPLLRQALGPDHGSYRSACTMLGSMCGAGRTEAGVHLLGLLQLYKDDLARLTVVVENLSHFRAPESVRALVNELHRVKSSNSTRGYLASVLRALSCFPPSLLQGSLRALAEDRSFSVKMRQEFNAVLEGCLSNLGGGA